MDFSADRLANTHQPRPGLLIQKGHLMLAALIFTFASLIGLAQPTSPTTTPAPAKPAATPASSVQKHMEWTVDGVKREGIVYAPASAATEAAPVVFAFHGHGGNARNAARTFDTQKQWPEAIVVYLEGLPTPGALTDPEGRRNGWQKFSGDLGDRDLKFFDAVLADLHKTYKVDDARIYSTGHSNGGQFTYLLWAARPDVFAAIAPSAGGLRDMSVIKKPLPVMHIAGEKDATVPFAFQKRIIEQVRKIDGCVPEGKEWAAQCTEYASSTGTPVVTMIHPGDHTYDKDAPALIVKFFKEHAKAGADATKPGDGKPTDSPKP
jgi:polyhydroxybutyrate depolymerase